MHGRPRDFKHKLKDPKAAEAYAKKVSRDRVAAAAGRGVLAAAVAQRRRRSALPSAAALIALLLLPPVLSGRCHQAGHRAGAGVPAAAALRQGGADSV